jgi:sulfofructose kinase
VVLDGDRVVEGTGRLLGRVDFPAVSEAFACAWAGADSPGEGLEKLAAGAARHALVTCGAGGALAAQGRRRIRCPAFDVAVRDTTGAGDAFHAGLIWALFQGSGAEAALRTACAVAALSCTIVGAQEGLPDAKTLAEFLATPPARRPGAAAREEEKDG